MIEQKQILISRHAQTRMLQRGADKEEIAHVIDNGKWEKAKRNK